MKALFALIIFGLSLCNIRGDNEARSGGFWAQIPPFARPLYVTGVLDGIIASPAMLASDPATARMAGGFERNVRQIFDGFEVGALTNKLDTFYREPRNRRIAIAAALLFVVSESRATTKPVQTELARALEDLRAHSKGQ